MIVTKKNCIIVVSKVVTFFTKIDRQTEKRMEESSKIDHTTNYCRDSITQPLYTNDSSIQFKFTKEKVQ